MLFAPLMSFGNHKLSSIYEIQLMIPSNLLRKKSNQGKPEFREFVLIAMLGNFPDSGAQ